MGLTYTKEDEKLFDVFVKLKTKEDVKNFLEDICTIKEVKDMSKRLEAAYLLHEGKSYQEVTQITGVSSATLARINKCINFGAGGYKKLLKKN